MELYHSYYGNFSNDFSSQLDAISSQHPKKTKIEYKLKIPNGFRYHYTDFSFIYAELSSVFQKRYPLGYEIINLVPSPHDDHFIHVTLRIQIQ